MNKQPNNITAGTPTPKAPQRRNIWRKIIVKTHNEVKLRTLRMKSWLAKNVRLQNSR